MTNDWAPEPLSQEDRYIIDGNNDMCKASEFWNDATLSRAIACYNACAGVPTEWLDSDMWQHIMSTFKCACTDDTKEATDGHDNIGPPAHDNFRWFPDPEDL